MPFIQLKYSNIYKVLGLGMSVLPASYSFHFRSPGRVLSPSHWLLLRISFSIPSSSSTHCNIQNPRCLLVPIFFLEFWAKCIFWNQEQILNLLPRLYPSSGWILIYTHFFNPLCIWRLTLLFLSRVLKKRIKRGFEIKRKMEASFGTFCFFSPCRVNKTQKHLKKKWKSKRKI